MAEDEDPLVLFMIELPKSQADAYTAFAAENNIDVSLVLRGVLCVASNHGDEVSALLTGMALAHLAKGES